MVQNPKGGGLSSTLGGSQQMGGVQKTTDFLDKSTWTLGILLIVLIMFSSLSFNSGGSDVKILNDKQFAPTRTEIPALKGGTPATELPSK
jgi:preprotein translocase subunit SecG